MLWGKFDCFNYHGKLAEASHSKKAEYSNRADLSAVYYIYCYEPRSSGNIVLICSEPGEGYNRQMAYPFPYPQVVSIASATAYGKEAPESVYVQAKYAFQGERIVVKTPSLGNDGVDEMSGTSVATAIAAGVASLVLATHRMAMRAASWAERDKVNALNEKIVTQVFDRMKGKNEKYVLPCDLFSKERYGESQAVLDWLHSILIKSE